MKAFGGQDIISLYVAALKADQPGISVEDTARHIEGNTKMTFVQYAEWAKGFQFRMETDVLVCNTPICQYVIVTGDGEMVFRDDGRWFVPGIGGDALFETFDEAWSYLVGRGLKTSEVGE